MSYLFVLYVQRVKGVTLDKIEKKRKKTPRGGHTRPEQTKKQKNKNKRRRHHNANHNNSAARTEKYCKY
jgi:hypothetical protein